MVDFFLPIYVDPSASAYPIHVIDLRTNTQ